MSDASDPSAPELSTTIRLVESARKGDRQALEDLFQRYLPRVRRIVAFRMGQRLRQLAEREDLVQEVLLRVFEGLDRFEHRSEGSFRNWLAHAVQAAIVDESRKVAAKKRGQGKVRRLGDFGSELLAAAIPIPQPTPSEIARARETEEELEAAILALPAHHRELIVLRHLCDLSYREIAELMRLSTEETARRASNRALARLKKSLGWGQGEA